MKEKSPCLGCTERHPACHGSCKAYQGWADQYHAQQKHLLANKNRFSVPMTAARDKAYSKHRIDKHTYAYGGQYE